MTERQRTAEHEPITSVTIREGSISDVAAARHMQVESWKATYPNEEAGVSKEWVAERTGKWLLPKWLERSREILNATINDPTQFYRIAEVNGRVVGFVHLSTKDDESKYIEGLYTSPETFGTGVGTKLMEVADTWINGAEAALEVATYNHRARRFYEKHGFDEVPNSNHVFAEIMPAIYMKRSKR